ncbi:MAG: M50 family metallopeptidase [Patescibacteria group bacterium]
MLSTILTLVIAFFSLIALMIIHEFGHFIIAKKFGVRVDEFGIGYPPKIFGKKIGETIYSINWLPLGAFVRIYGEEGGIDDYRSFMGLKIWKRVLIVIGGVVAFWMASIILFTIVFGIGANIPIGDQDVQGVANSQIKIINVESGSPAGLAGLQEGDSLLEFKKIKDFQDFAKNHAGQQISLKIQRDNKVFDINLTPRTNPAPGQGAIGVGLERLATLINKHPWYEAPLQGVIFTWQTTANGIIGLYSLFANMFSGKGVPQGAEFAGPLGITVFLARAVDYGPGFFLYFIGVISVFVAIFNLFPIPALDGGKLIFLAIEKIMKKPVPIKIEQNITMIFFILLISLSIFVTIRFDIPRFSEFLKSSLQR